jgi:poly-gamma-glutamate synthesis protein (capsule biosynthesis protein)
LESSASAPATATEEVSSSDPNTLVVVAGGDVSFGRECGQELLADANYNPLEPLAPVLDSADLRLVNLESTLTDQGGLTQSPKNRLIFTGPPEGALSLARAGIDVVSVANNHAWDFHEAGFRETLGYLDPYCRICSKGILCVSADL